MAFRFIQHCSDRTIHKINARKNDKPGIHEVNMAVDPWIVREVPVMQ